MNITDFSVNVQPIFNKFVKYFVIVMQQHVIATCYSYML